jgi:hypothetical protein
LPREVSADLKKDAYRRFIFPFRPDSTKEGRHLRQPAIPAVDTVTIKNLKQEVGT